MTLPVRLALLPLLQEALQKPHRLSMVLSSRSLLYCARITRASVMCSNSRR